MGNDYLFEKYALPVLNKVNTVASYQYLFCSHIAEEANVNFCTIDIINI
jgi:hypothetical protein